jgi:hypothetical protein
MVTSLTIKDAQFLSNAPGMAGGSSLPFGFGSRSLANIQELGPNLLSCSDSDVTLQFKFGEEDMTWTLTNRGKEEAKFNMALSPSVTVSRKDNTHPAKLTSKQSSVVVTGIDSISDSENGRVLHMVVKGGSSKQLMLKAGGN